MQPINRLIDQSKNYHQGFTLIEMLVVIGIITVLAGVAVTSFSKMAKTADRTKAQELISQAATALAAIYEADGMWPKAIRSASNDDTKGVLGNDSNSKVALILAQRGYMSLSAHKDKSGNVINLQGRDRFGILTPWAAKVVDQKSSVSLGDKVNGTSTLRDNLLRFAVDLDGDGEITEDEGCGRVNTDRDKLKAKKSTNVEVIRATAAVWCIDKDGKDILTSWTAGQEQKLQ